MCMKTRLFQVRGRGPCGFRALDKKIFRFQGSLFNKKQFSYFW